MAELSDFEDEAQRGANLQMLEKMYQSSIGLVPEHSAQLTVLAHHFGEVAVKTGRIFADKMANVGIFTLGVLAHAIYDDERRYRG